MSDLKKVAGTQEKYYGELLDRFGAGVDAVASGKQIYKDLRYKKLSQVLADDNDFTVHDVGFGVGHYYEYLKQQFPDKKFEYSGSEVTKGFVEHCDKAYPDDKFYHRDLAETSFDDKYDYLIFGGTFYHKVDTPDDEFTKFVEAILPNAFAMSKKGISFNFITEHVDFQYPDLYYGEIEKITRFVVNNLSRYFTIDHAYPLYEFTMCVYQEDYVKSLYPQEEFAKYYKKG